MTRSRRRCLLAALATILGPAALGCARLVARRDSPAEPSSHRLVRDQLVLLSDFPLPLRHRVIDDLVALRGDVYVGLALPASDEPIRIHLFETEERYRTYVRRVFPDVPDRRAFFLESETSLDVYAHWSERVAEDLRHETAHGYLHAVAPAIPLWLDEGLAEHFEVPRGRGGLNRPHAELLAVRLRAGGWRPHLGRLEALTTAGVMQQADYAEAWAWVHWLLEAQPGGREVIRAYLDEVRATDRAPPFAPRLATLGVEPLEALPRHVLAAAESAAT